MPLVSRRFSEACRDPSLWPELRVLHASFLTEARWRSFLRWLAVRGSGLQTLTFGKDEVGPLPIISIVCSSLFARMAICSSVQKFERTGRSRPAMSS